MNRPGSRYWSVSLQREAAAGLLEGEGGANGVLHKFVDRPELSQSQEDQNDNIGRHDACIQEGSNGKGPEQGLVCSATYSMSIQIADEEHQHPAADGVGEEEEGLGMAAEEGDGLHAGRGQPAFPRGEQTGKAGGRARRRPFILTGFGTSCPCAFRPRQEEKQDCGQPDGDAQDADLDRDIAGEVAGEAEDCAGSECGNFAAGQAADQHVGEEAGKKDVEGGLHLEPVEPSHGAAVEAGQEKEGVADGVEDGGLRVGEEGVAGEGVRVPQGQPQVEDGGLLKEAEGQEVAGEVAVGEGGQAEQVGREEEEDEGAVGEGDRKGRRLKRALHLAVAGRHRRVRVEAGSAAEGRGG